MIYNDWRTSSSFQWIKTLQDSQCGPIPEWMTLMSRFFLVNQKHTNWLFIWHAKNIWYQCNICILKLKLAKNILTSGHPRCRWVCLFIGTDPTDFHCMDKKHYTVYQNISCWFVSGGISISVQWEPTSRRPQEYVWLLCWRRRPSTPLTMSFISILRSEGRIYWQVSSSIPCVSLELNIIPLISRETIWIPVKCNALFAFKMSEKSINAKYVPPTF